MSDIVLRGEVLPAQTDLMAAFARFLRIDVAQGDASPETVRTYQSQVGEYVAWCREHGVDPAHATVEDVKVYRAALVEEGHKRTTIGTKLSAIRRLYAAAVANGLRPDNPAVGLKPPKEKTARAERVKWLPLATIKALLATPDADTTQGKRDRAILALMALHGLRVVEVHRLDLEDLDFDASTVGTVRVLGKGKKERTVYLVERSAAPMRAWLAARRDVAAEGTRAVFVSTQHGKGTDAGGRIGRRGLRKLVKSYLKRVGVDEAGLSCHALRHSFATLSHAAGAPLDVVSKDLGHASITTTQIYADIVDRVKNNPALFLVGALDSLGAG